MVQLFSMCENEEWRPVVGAEERYSVSSYGRVRSEDYTITRSNGWRQSFSQKIRPLQVHGTGHLAIKIQYVQGALGKPRLVHQLIAESFIGPKPEGMEVRHKNDVKTDNRSSNLEYGTHSQNAFDSVRNGTHYNASKERCVKGHDFSEENTYQYTSGGRSYRTCKTCRRAIDKRRRAR